MDDSGHRPDVDPAEDAETHRSGNVPEWSREPRYDNFGDTFVGVSKTS